MTTDTTDPRALLPCPMGCIGEVIGGEHEGACVYCTVCHLRAVSPQAWNTRQSSSTGEVTQEDREAQAQLYENVGKPGMAEEIRAGEQDDHPGVQAFARHRHRFASPQTAGEVGELVERLRSDLEAIQRGDRPLPWVVHSGCSYRRIASEPTRENFRSFPDGNVLHAYNQQSDGHPDLSMGEDQLCALIRLVNALPQAADTIASLTAERDAALERCEELEKLLRDKDMGDA